MMENSFLNMKNSKMFYIDGEWVEPLSKDTIKVINPSTRKTIAEVASANEEDTKLAISAARKAFDNGPWTKLQPGKRAEFLYQIAEKIQQNEEYLAKLETLNNGKTLKESISDVDETVKTFKYYAGLCAKPDGTVFESEYPFTAKIIREPIGVCGLIIPWNYPLLMASWKIAPALAAGNTCILKPSEVTPLTAIKLFEIIDEVGLPPGVINLVNGLGPSAAEPLTKSKLVDKIAFTGGTETGKRVLTNSISNLKKVTLELGGKSPNIIFKDADLNTAIDHAIFGIFNNSGQVCSAGSRLLVEKSIYEDVVKELVNKTKKIKVGDGMSQSSQMGPLVNLQQYNKVLNYIKIGIDEGATLIFGGNPINKSKGYFIEPTIFRDVNPNMTIAQEEIFGPVLSVIPFNNEEDAIKIANGTSYGLAGAVFTSDVAKAERMAKNIRSGTVWINTYEQAPIEGSWGGYKESGIGRELGVDGYLSFSETKQIINNLVIEPTGWFD